MRQTRKMLGCVAAVLLGVLGCQTTPDLRPPKQAEVLNSPDVPRYATTNVYPPDVLASDPVKQAMKLQAGPAPLRTRPPGMSGPGGSGAMGMTGMSSGGY